MILKDVFCVLSKAFNIRYSMIFEHSLENIYVCVCKILKRFLLS